MPYKDPQKAKESASAWRLANPEKSRAINARSARKNAHKYRDQNIARLRAWRASLTKEQPREIQLRKWHLLWDRKLGWARGTHERIFNGAIECALCGEPFSEFNDNLRKDTDHCHKLMKF